MKTVEELKKRIQSLEAALGKAIEEADSWYDECRGGGQLASLNWCRSLIGQDPVEDTGG